MKLVALVIFAAACGGSEPPPAQPQPPATPSRPMAQPAPVPQPVATFSMPASCLAYRQAVMELTKCDQMASAREGIMQGLDAMERGFAQMANVPEDGRVAAMNAASTGCQAGLDAIKQAVAAMGC